jgi:hypothetical protein
MAHQLQTLGMKTMLMGGETRTRRSSYRRRPGFEAASVTQGSARIAPQWQGIRGQLQGTVRPEIGLYAPYFYDGVMLIATAMKAAIRRIRRSICLRSRKSAIRALPQTRVRPQWRPDARADDDLPGEDGVEVISEIVSSVVSEQ